MKIYTKTGDDGTTALVSGTRVPKYHLRIETYGSVDELNAYIGLIRDTLQNEHNREVLLTIQHNIFVICSNLANDNSNSTIVLPQLRDVDIKMLENEIDRIQAILPPQTHFILPGGHASVSYCHIARTVCRRAERLCLKLDHKSPIDKNILLYMNRLSDYLYVLARETSQQLEVQEIFWISKK